MKKTANHKKSLKKNTRQKNSFSLRNFLQFFLMIPVIFLALFSATFFTAQVIHAAAGINRTINFQGRVVNKSDGTNVTNGTYSFTFKLYDAPSGGNLLWQETQSSVSVTNGIFQVALGSSTAFNAGGYNVNFNTNPLYLDITFNSETFGSRIQLAAVPYAINAEQLDGVVATQSASGFNLTGGSSTSSTASFTTSGSTLTFQPGNSGGLTVQSNGANGLALDTGGAATVSIGTTNASAITIGNNSATNNTAVTLTSGGSGLITLGSNTGTGNVLIQPNAGGQAALVIKDQGVGDLLTASAGASTKFVISNAGNIRAVAGAEIQPLTDSTTGLQIATSGNTPLINFDTSNSFMKFGTGTTVYSGGTCKGTGANAACSPFHFVTATGNHAFTIENTGANILTLTNANGGVPYEWTFNVGAATNHGDFGLYDTNGVPAFSISPYTSFFGIGKNNTSPAAVLHVEGPSAGNAALIVNQVSATTDDIFTASASGTTKFSIQNNGALAMFGTSGYTGFVAAATSPSLIYTMPSAVPGGNGYMLVSQTDGTLSWVSPGTCSTCIVQAPSATAANTITVGNTSGVVGLTVNGTTNVTTADVADFTALVSNSKTATNGILFNQNGGGTTTNGIQIEQSAGALVNGLTFSGTMTNLISSTSFTVTNAGDITAGKYNGTTNSATAFTIAASGTNYGLQVDESATSAVTGLKITSAAAGGGLALSVINGNADENLTLDAKGSGTITIGGTSTGNILLGANTGGGLGDVVVQPNAGGRPALIVNQQSRIGIANPDIFDASASGVFKFGIDSGGNATAAASLNVGQPSLGFANAVGNFSGNINNYMQVQVQNHSNGNAASSDFIATADNGTDTTNYIDLGINGSAYNQAAYNIGSANDGYLYTSNGALTIGTAAFKPLIFHTNGTTSGQEALRIDAMGKVNIGTVGTNGGGNAQLAINQTNNEGSNDIFTASASGTTKFTLTNGGSINLIGGQTSDIDTIGTSNTLKIGISNQNGLTLGRSGAATTINGSSLTFGGATGISGALTVTATSTTALAVGRQGATSPALVVDSSTNASSVTGLKIVAGAAGGGLALSEVGGNSNENLTLGAEGTGNITIGSSSTTTITLGGSGSNGGLTFNINGGPSYTGTGRPTRQMVLSAEYPGAVLTASASANVSGNMTSDASPSASPTSYDWQNYYMWSAQSDTSPTMQTYTVAVRVTLPKDFSAWASGNAVTVAYNTAFASNTLNALDVYLYKDGDTTGSPVAFSTGNASAKSWATVSFTGAQMGGGPQTWGSTSSDAGKAAVFYLKMKSTNAPNYVQVGDIILNYLAAY